MRYRRADMASAELLGFTGSAQPTVLHCNGDGAPDNPWPDLSSSIGNKFPIIQWQNPNKSVSHSSCRQ